MHDSLRMKNLIKFEVIQVFSEMNLLHIVTLKMFLYRTLKRMVQVMFGFEFSFHGLLYNECNE